MLGLCGSTQVCICNSLQIRDCHDGHSYTYGQHSNNYKMLETSSIGLLCLVGSFCLEIKRMSLKYLRQVYPLVKAPKPNS